MFFIFAILSFSIAYKRAKATGRNGILWGIIASVVFAGTGLSLSSGMSILLGIGLEIWGWSETVVTTLSIIGGIISVVLSFVTTWLILRYLNRTYEETFLEPPLQPIFEQKSD
jgi:hypothetical protein